MKDWTGNRNSVKGVLGVGGDDREINDFYATEPVAAEWLIKLETLAPAIWECACGQGHLGKVLEGTHAVKATDLIDRGYGEGGVDFLQQTEVFDGDIVTNPPYRYAQEFVEKALSLVPEGHKVCMFLKVQFLEGKKRRRLFDANPPARIWVSSSRLHCGKNGIFSKGNMIAYAWYVWEKGYKGDTVVKWFN